MRGHLQLTDLQDPLDVWARVVIYPSNGVGRASFHHELSRYVGRTGRLTLDDGTDFDVRVGGGFLEILPPATV
ncbi:MAG TPA: hypothetical protein VGF22_08080 [Acidimicrobiales bacterium]